MAVLGAVELSEEGGVWRSFCWECAQSSHEDQRCFPTLAEENPHFDPTLSPYIHLARYVPLILMLAGSLFSTTRFITKTVSLCRVLASSRQPAFVPSKAWERLTSSMHARCISDKVALVVNAVLMLFDTRNPTTRDTVTDVKDKTVLLVNGGKLGLYPGGGTQNKGPRNATA